jgi:hypothetical protein
MSAVRKVRVVTKGKKTNIPFFLAVCKSILAAITAHPSLFPNLPVLLTLLQKQVQDLDDYQRQTKDRVPGAAALRNTARDDLFTSVEAIRAYVQGLCDTSPEQAATLAQSAGMKLAAASVRSKPILGAKQGPQPGVVNLEANATLLANGVRSTRYRFYNWQYSVDGKTWITVPSTPYAKTIITGLTPLTTYEFRVSLTDKNGQGAWSQTLSFLVH